MEPIDLPTQLELLAQRYANQFTREAHAELLQILYSNLFGYHSDYFLPEMDVPRRLEEWEGFNLSKRQKLAEELLGPKKRKACGKGFEKGDVIYRCKTCSLSDTFSTMCTSCYHSSHSPTTTPNHVVTLKISQGFGGGAGDVCHCGSEGWWATLPHCEAHPHHQHDQDALAPPEPEQEVQFPPDILSQIYLTLSATLDYLLNTLDFSVEETALPRSEADLKGQPIVPRHTSHHSMLQSTSEKSKTTWSVVLWNDEKHTREDVATQLGDAIAMEEEEGYHVAEKIHTHGRATITTMSSIPHLLHIAHTLAQIDLSVTLRSSYDTFRESCCSAIITFLLDLSTSTVQGDALVLSNILSDALLDQREIELPFAKKKAGLDTGVIGTQSLTRLDWLLVYHTRLWKQPRQEVLGLIGRLILGEEGRSLKIAASYAKVLPRLIDLLLFMDRESDFATASLSFKIFPVPKLAAHIVHSENLLVRYLQVLRSFYTNQFAKKRLILPPDNTLRVDPDSDAFKIKKVGPLFGYLKELLSSQAVRSYVAGRKGELEEMVNLLELFTSMNPMMRAARDHVEYESEAWVKAFQVSGELGRLARNWSESYGLGQVQSLAAAIGVVSKRMFDVLSMGPTTIQILDRSKFPTPENHVVNFGIDGEEFSTVSYDVSNSYVSFHNPLHWLLAGMLKHVGMLRRAGEVGFKDVRQLLVQSIPLDMVRGKDDNLEKAKEKWLLLLMDFPLRVVVYVAQLRNGLWVRNGQSMRTQHHHYREHTALGMREVAWDNDIFLLQVAFTVLPPNLVLATFLDRFELLDWFSGTIEHPVFEFPSAGMVEEFLLLVITCLSEPSNIASWSTTKFVRREVIHALVLGPTSYSDLTKKLPERANDCTELRVILNEVATYKPPVGTTDVGLYELKEPCFEEVEPLFYHYSRNQKQEAEDVLAQRYKVATGASIKDFHFVPKRIELDPDNPYASILLAFESPFLCQIVFFTLHNLIPLHRLATQDGSTTQGKARESQESVIELALHLACLCLVERPDVFARLASEMEYVEGITLVRLLSDIEGEDIFRSVKVRIAWCLDAINSSWNNGSVARWRIAKPVKEVKVGGPQSTAQKKAKAQARQAAIMQKFSADQQAFLDAQGDEEDEMSDVENSSDIVYGSCMVCQEDCTSSLACGCLAFIQPSKLMRLSPLAKATLLQDVAVTPHDMDRDTRIPVTPLIAEENFPQENFKFGLYSSTCGHLMHLNCFEGYTATTVQRHHSQAARNHPENVARKEFVCPLCKSLGNVLLPMQNPYDAPTKPFKRDDLPLRDWMRLINTEALREVPDTAKLWDHRLSTGELIPLFAEGGIEIKTPLNERNALFDPTQKMLGDIYSVILPISQQSLHLRPRSPTFDDTSSNSSMYLPDELCAYTLAILEITQRGQEPGSGGSSVSDSLSAASSLILKCVLASMHNRAAAASGGELGLLNLRYGLFARLLPGMYRDSKFTAPFLLRDPMGVLVESAAICHIYFQPVLILTYYAEVCRAVIGLIHLFRSYPGRSTTWFKLASEAPVVKNIFGDVRQIVGCVCADSRILQFEAAEHLLGQPDHVLSNLLYAYTLPFLRRASMLHRVIRGSSAGSGAKHEDSECEYRRLLRQLNIQTPAEGFASQNTTLTENVSAWCRQFGAFYGPRSQTALIRLEHPTIYELISLPQSLDTLFESFTQRTCKKCGICPNVPGICLFCGEFVCVGSACCREEIPGAAEGLGECNMHMRNCNAPVGLFLDLRKWQVLWLWAGSGSWGSNVYLDIHGEIDPSMKRGFPQYLHQPRLDEIRKAWLTHSVPSFVARKMEALLDGGGWSHF